MISEYLGIDSDYIVIGLAALVLILIIVMIVNAAKMHSLKKAYNNFMTGKDAKNLEEHQPYFFKHEIYLPKSGTCKIRCF